MKVRLEKEEGFDFSIAKVGDILSGEYKHQGNLSGRNSKAYYLIVRDAPRSMVTLLNLGENNLMSGLTASTPEEVVRKAIITFSNAVDFKEIISRHDFELVRV